MDIKILIGIIIAIIVLVIIILATATNVFGNNPPPVDGIWSNWIDGRCNSICGPGKLTKTRECNNPAPKHGGKECVGDTNKIIDCKIKECPINGGWTAWNDGKCNQSCGPGKLVRTRKCTNPAPKYDGEYCSGGSTNSSLDCKIKECPVHGGWSDWSKGQCNKTCGKGQLVRNRTCNNPTPKYGGKGCVGPKTDYSLPCKVKECCNKTACNNTMYDWVIKKNWRFNDTAKNFGSCKNCPSKWYTSGRVSTNGRNWKIIRSRQDAFNKLKL
jgi:hypothetical protein